MEFTRTLEKALQLGVTKKEFLQQWEAEAKKSSHEGAISSTTSKIQNFPGVANNDEVMMKSGQVSHQWQQVKDELKEDVRLMLQLVFSQHVQKEQGRWQQLNSKLTQIEKEFRHQNEILCQHVNNTVESQSSSLKLYLTQELDTLKQEFDRIIDQRCIRHVTTPNSSDASPKNNNTYQHEKTLKGASTPGGRNYCLKDHEDESISKSHLLHKDNTKLDVELKMKGKNGSRVLVGQRKDVNRDHAKEEEELSDNSEDEVVDAEKPVASVSNVILHNGWDEFIIPDSDEFSTACRTFVRKLTIQPAQFRKARLIIKFNAAEELKVELRVAEDQNEGNRKWPLKIAGTGYIFNPCSKHFTEVWKIQSTTCHMPSSPGYVPLPADVCLSTNKNNYPNVTIEQLKERHYADDDQLKFEWKLKVETDS